MQFRRSTLARRVTSLLLVALFTFASATPSQITTKPTGEIGNRGYLIAHQGQLDTDLQFGEFFPGIFTMSAWVMPQFTYNECGVIFGVNGPGSFVVGQGDYTWGNGGYDKPGDPVLWVKVNNQQAKYLAPGYQREKWNHIAVVHSLNFGFNFIALYLNGQKLTAFTKVGDTVQVGAPDVNPGGYSPAGTLRIGHGYQDKCQFYGLVDDVAVYNNIVNIGNLMNSPISGSHPNLVAGYTFDVYPPNTLLPAKLKRPVTPTPRALHLQIPIGTLPKSDWDALWFYDYNVLSRTTVPRRLPIPKNQVWRVVQEFDSRGGSHNGFAAFNWDFARADGPPGDAEFTAATSGKIDFVDHAANGKLHLRVTGTEEVDSYIHTATSSFEQVFMIPNDILFSPNPLQPYTWLSVEQGQALARTDPIKKHLHFGANYRPESESATGIPASFRNYQTSADGVNWSSTIIQYGIPRKNQYVRRVD